MADISTNNKPKDREVEIKGIKESGAAEPSRMSDSLSAYSLFQKIKDEDNTASRYRSKIQGQLDGNPPRDPAKMRRLGLGGFSNVNFREAEGVIEMNASSFWDLDMDVPSFISVKVYDDRKLAIPDELHYGNIIADEYTRTLKEWPGYFYNRMLSILEMLRYGCGPVYWPDEDDWRFRATKSGTVLFPADTSALLKEPELVMIRDSKRVGELFKFIETDEDKEDAEAEGWNVNEIKEAILRAQKSRPPVEKRMQIGEWESVQQQIKNNDYAANYITCNPVKIVHILVREIKAPRKISHYIICEDEERSEFLFKKLSDIDNMSNMINLFLAGVGDGYVKSVKGLGHKIYPHVEQSNRFLNHMVNCGYLSSSLIISTTTPNALSLTQFGPVTVIPRHAEPAAGNWTPNLDQLAKVRNALHSVLNSNTGVFKRSSGGGEGGPPRTAHEVNIEEIKNARLEKTQVNIHYLQLDALHKEVFRRLIRKDYPDYAEGYKEAKEFRQRCIDRGVPEELLNTDHCVPTAARAVGRGSAVAQDAITREMLGVSDRFPVIGQNNALRDFVAARVGHDDVDRYVPVVTMRDVPNSETSVATLENNSIVQGMNTLVGADQPHPIHVPIHLGLLNEIAQAYMQNREGGQVDVVKTHDILTRGLQHCGQHFQFWARNPARQQEREAMEDNAKQLQQLAQRLEPKVRQIQEQMMVAQQQQQQAQQQQPSPEMQLKLKQIDEEAQIKRENMLRQNQIREEKAAHAMRLNETKTAAQIAMKGVQNAR